MILKRRGQGDPEPAVLQAHGRYAFMRAMAGGRRAIVGDVVAETRPVLPEEGVPVAQGVE
jgi:hypothetical protein